MGTPRVAIITPVYNGAPWLADCIESILSQSYDNWTYVIADDCSTDGSAEIAEGYAARDPRITVHRQTTYLPVIPNWNRTLALLPDDAVYLKMVLADDMLYPGCLERMLEVAEEFPSVGVVSAYEQRGNEISLRGLPTDRRFFPGREICHQVLTQGGYYFGSPNSTLLRADLVRARNPAFYNEDYLVRDPRDAARLERLWPSQHSVFVHFHADSEVCYALLAESDFGFVHEVLTYTRMHPETITSNWTTAIDTWTPGTLATMLRYGPLFLDDHEHRRVIRTLVRHYERRLLAGIARLRVARNSNFRRYHSEALERLQPALRDGPVRAPLLSLIRILLRSAHRVGMWRARRSSRRDPARLEDRAEVLLAKTAAAGLQRETPALAGVSEVGDPGFEPGTSALSERRSNQLS